MKSSTIKKSALMISTLMILLLYQNCSKVQVADMSSLSGALKTSSVSTELGNSNENGAPIVDESSITGLLPEQNQRDLARKSCEDFLSLSSAGRIDLNAQSDMSMVSQFGNITVSNAVRNLKLDNVVGNIKIKSAINVSIDKLRGNISINADHVSSMNEVTGNICLAAQTIGSISSGAGNAHVYADSIESVTVQTGNFHIYGAIIKSATVLRGNICLHNGAQILNSSEIIGNFRTCD